MTKTAPDGSRPTPREPAPKDAATGAPVVDVEQPNHDHGLDHCGALGKEIVDLIDKHGWDAEIVDIPAVVHVFPGQIAPKVEAHILALRRKYERLIVLFGDCGSKGALDQMLEKYPDIERISGPHCYEFYGGELFAKLMEEEPGTFFLTDFMVSTFQGLIIKSMGLDCFPELKQEYFRNYKRLVYLVQKDNPEYRQKAHKVAKYLELPLTIIETGYGSLEERLAALMGDKS